MAAPTPSDPGASWLGTWSRPVDRPGQIAFALACVLLVTALVPGGPRRLIAALDFSGTGEQGRPRRFLIVAGLAAAFLTIAYVDVYLHGGPRGVDAPIYWLQARVLSHGSFSWTVPSPIASYRARGLIATFPDRLSGILPPGYPLLLAAGFLVGAPMLVGPLISGCLVACTWLLAGELVDNAADMSAARHRQAAALAVGLSVVCAALRQQTADTLPHGAAALAIATALTSALRGRRTDEPRLFAISGLALGWLVSARPMGGLAVAGITGVLILRSVRPRQSLTWSLAAAIPGVVLLLGANHAATGHAFVSPASIYAQSVVETAVPIARGADRVALAAGALRRHVMDVANFEPLALALLLALSTKYRTMASMCTAVVVAGHLAAQSCGLCESVVSSASCLSEVLPLEHALIAYGVAAAFPASFERLATAVLGMALGGFAVHASAAHAATCSSDLGRPHFEPDALQEVSATAGLLFFDDDQAFELATRPGLEANRGIQAVRSRGDDHDRLVYELAGGVTHPSARRYLATAAGTSIPFWSPGSNQTFWRFEAESDWPPMMASGGSASRLQVTTSCVSGASALGLTPNGPGEASLTLELPVPPAPSSAPTRLWTITPRVYDLGRPAEGSLDVVLASPGNPPLAHWSWTDEGKGGPSCRDLPAAVVELGRAPTKAWLILTARGGEVALDRTLLR